MKIKDRFLTILVVIVAVLLLAGVGAFAASPGKAAPPRKAADLEGRMLGGVAGRMPDDSSKIFFESMLGCRLAGYISYDSVDAALCGLKTGEVSAIWAADISADRLLATDDALARLDISETAAIEQTAEPRTEFGFAMKNDDKGRKLAAAVSTVVDFLMESGELDEIIAAQTDTSSREDDLFRVSDMKSSGAKTLRIGVTGTVPPIELIDSEGHPYGFCVALSDRVAELLGMKAELVVLDGETVFTSLMSGRIDAVFCYGSGRITTEGTPAWVTTSGYLPMQRYEFLTLK